MPTRNRADLIGEALESVVSQADDRVEIVIIDGASTDNTADVVQQYQKKFKNIVYYQLEENGGVDSDMAKAIKLASGEYCWLLSDDDALKPGAIKRMLKEIESGCEIYICNTVRCDINMRPIREHLWLSLDVGDRVFDLHNKKQLIEYCNKATSIGALFSFWSTTIFRREEWLKVGLIPEFDGSAYAMASTLLSFIKVKCRLKYVRDSLVLWRHNTDGCLQNRIGLVKRFLIDFDGYLRLADKYFSDDSKTKNSFLKVMTREHPWHTIINVTSFINNSIQWKSFKDKMLNFGYNPQMIMICYALGRFKKLVALGVMIKRKILKI